MGPRLAGRRKSTNLGRERSEVWQDFYYWRTCVSDFDVIILGAGAAGMMCAAVASQRGKRVVLLDHANKAGKKILISGGGRCNFTNIYTEPKCFLSANPHFVKSALKRYTPSDFIALVERYDIAWHEKTLGQLFCDGSARQIVAMLLAECRTGGVTIELGQAVRDVKHSDSRFTVVLEQQNVRAPKLVLATGGPSIPKMGATGFAYDVARAFGLKVEPPRPALVPFMLGADQSHFTELAGVSAQTSARIGKTSFREAFLFTHRGMSGPAILQISSYWRPGQSIALNLTPDYAAGWLLELKRQRPKNTLRSALGDFLPARLVLVMLRVLQKEGLKTAAPLGALTDKKLAAIEARLGDWHFSPVDTEGYAKAEVTVGGISTDELSSRTMAVKKLPGLYCIGECVDVTGWLGGYNFQWAWASGVAAGESI